MNQSKYRTTSSYRLLGKVEINQINREQTNSLKSNLESCSSCLWFHNKNLETFMEVDSFQTLNSVTVYSLDSSQNWLPQYQIIFLATFTISEFRRKANKIRFKKEPYRRMEYFWSSIWWYKVTVQLWLWERSWREVKCSSAYMKSEAGCGEHQIVCGRPRTHPNRLISVHLC